MPLLCRLVLSSFNVRSLYIDREATSVRVDVRVISTIHDVKSSFNKDTFTA